MAIINNITKLKKGLKTIESLAEKEPIMVISQTGEVWLSESAKKKLSEKKIDVSEMRDWLMIGVKHLSEASCYGIKTFMVPIPTDTGETEVLIILSDEYKNKYPVLTMMEKKVLKYLVKGLPNKDIAINLNIGPGTVNAHLDNIYRKFGVSNRAEAICIAVKLGITVPKI
ncbi:MAG: hypothetical protein HY754_03560 [Nitrospirae bacterium]|nr:hypothetical protein [Nitrospirota bacterium]